MPTYAPLTLTGHEHIVYATLDDLCAVCSKTIVRGDTIVRSSIDRLHVSCAESYAAALNVQPNFKSPDY